MACNLASVFHQARNISVGQYKTGQANIIKLVALMDNCRRKSRQRMMPEMRPHVMGLQSLDLISPDCFFALTIRLVNKHPDDLSMSNVAELP